jgi:hypothetical protein
MVTPTGVYPIPHGPAWQPSGFGAPEAGHASPSPEPFTLKPPGRDMACFTRFPPHFGQGALAPGRGTSASNSWSHLLQMNS